MKTYARIENGKVMELIAKDDGAPISAYFHPDIVAQLVDITKTPDVVEGDEYDGASFKHPPAPALSDIKANVIRSIDADVDAIYAAVIGNRQAEYDLAEKDAQAYKAAGYAGTVPASVQAWADAKKQTAKWAADDILATSANWRTLQADIRAYRLGRKEDARNAADVAGVDAVMTTWAEYVTRTRAALGV